MDELHVVLMSQHCLKTCDNETIGIDFSRNLHITDGLKKLSSFVLKYLYPEQ